MAKKIYQARGEEFSRVWADRLGLGWYSQITDEELAKSGNSTFAEYIRCGRIAVTREGSFDNYEKNRSFAEKYKNVGKK